VARITFDFSGKVALITGGSRGIGRATALLFAKSGAKVVIGDVDPAGDETVETIKRDGGEAVFVRTDVRDESDVKKLIAIAIKTYGGLNCAFNNAGVLPPTMALVEMEESTFDQTLAVDLKGVFLCMKHEITHMLQSGGGAIVNTASIAGPDRRAGNQRLYRRQTWRHWIIQSGCRRIRKSGDSHQRARARAGRYRNDQGLVR
jgi:NAD(P)-dependent dehydrogenase (short-subunit alcohol dehydrogenase family)